MWLSHRAQRPDGGCCVCRAANAALLEQWGAEGPGRGETQRTEQLQRAQRPRGGVHSSPLARLPLPPPPFPAAPTSTEKTGLEWGCLHCSPNGPAFLPVPHPPLTPLDGTRACLPPLVGGLLSALRSHQHTSTLETSGNPPVSPQPLSPMPALGCAGTTCAVLSCPPPQPLQGTWPVSPQLTLAKATAAPPDAVCERTSRSRLHAAHRPEPVRPLSRPALLLGWVPGSFPSLH